MCDDSFQEGNFLAEFEDELADEPFLAQKPSEHDPIIDAELKNLDSKKDSVADSKLLDQ